MTIMPHNHQMWAVIGICGGREHNMFWRRLPDGSGRVEAALRVGDAEPLGHNVIHSVTSPIPRLRGAIHVYRGDFLRRSEVSGIPESLDESRYDVAKNMKLFEDANALASHANAWT